MCINIGIAVPPELRIAVPPELGIAVPPELRIAVPPELGIAAPPELGIAAEIVRFLINAFFTIGPYNGDLGATSPGNYSYGRRAPFWFSQKSGKSLRNRLSDG